MAKNQKNKNDSVRAQDFEPLLDLTTERVPKSIKIDGKKYNLKAIEDMSIMERAKFEGYGKTLERVSRHKGKFTEATEKEYNKILLDFIVMILPDAERRVLNKLTIWQRIAVIEAFMVETNLLRAAKVAALAGKSPKKKK